MLTDEQKIEEAHGIWELAAASALACARQMHSKSLPLEWARLSTALEDERRAMAGWLHVSNAVLARDR